MWLDRLVQKLMPREEHFFTLLEQGAAHATSSSELLKECCGVRSFAEREAVVQKMEGVEHAADRVIQEMYEALNRTFVTPMDRTDIYNLATDLENITDLVRDTGNHIIMHVMEDIPTGSLELAEKIHAACLEIRTAVGLLRQPAALPSISAHCSKITSLEGEGDKIFRSGIVTLFKHEKDAIRLIKHKEFLEGLENTLDECDNVGNVLATIVIKNA